MCRPLLVGVLPRLGPAAGMRAPRPGTGPAAVCRGCGGRIFLPGARTASLFLRLRSLQLKALARDADDQGEPSTALPHGSDALTPRTRGFCSPRRWTAPHPDHVPAGCSQQTASSCHLPSGGVLLCNGQGHQPSPFWTATRHYTHTRPDLRHSPSYCVSTTFSPLLCHPFQQLLQHHPTSRN